MIVLELDKVEVDYCLECGGIWLDAGELELLVEDGERVRQILQKVSEGDRMAQGRLKCPICGRRMDEIPIGSEGAIRIDCCRKGHGFWFDRGELRVVAEILGDSAGDKVSDLLRDIFDDKNNQ